jgi:hypothetical protein
MNRSPLVVLAAASLVAGGALASSPAVAGGNGQTGQPRTIAEGLLTPLKLALSDHGTAYVSQNFVGELTKISKDGTKTTFASAPGEEVGGVEEHDGTVYWTTTGEGSSKLFSQRRGQDPQQVADLYEHESTTNPDEGTTYGFRNLPASCADQFDDENPATYTGIVDSHPYATLVTDRRHKTYVADAGANAILKVGRNGRVTTAAVLPAVPTVATTEALEAEGLPTCAAGYKYWFEFVPTDVEEGRDGSLYVTSLPGGPEDDSLGARGAVYKVDPWSGHVKKILGGFVGAVDLALLPDGRIAVAELFGGDEGQGQVTLARVHSSRRTTLALTSPAAVEWYDGSSARGHHRSQRHGQKAGLYVTTDAFVNGEPAPVGKLQFVPVGTQRHSSHHHH